MEDQKTLGMTRIMTMNEGFQFELKKEYKKLLNKELDKKEVQEGLIKACDVIDLIIEDAAWKPGI